MTETWQRRAAGITGLIALLGVALLMVAGSHVGFDPSIPDRSLAGATATDHSAFAALPETRPAFAFVESVVLLGLGLVLLAGLADISGAGALLVGADGVVRQRRWRARLVGAPPSTS